MRARKARSHVVAAVVGLGLGIAAASSPAFAAERAYELVTPPGSDPEVRQGGGVATPGGDFVCFTAENAIAGAPPNGITTADDGYCSRRGASGWDTQWVTGPAPRVFRGGRGGQVYYVSPDGRRVVFASDAGIFPDYPGPPAGSAVYGGTLSAFMWEGGETRWLAPTPEPLSEKKRRSGDPAEFLEREAVGASADLTHGIFVSLLRLLPADRNSEVDMYEWTPDGIRLVSRDAGGDAVGGFPATGTELDQVQAEPGSITPDGSRVFFERIGAALEGSPAGVKSVFMREGETLRHVSPRRGGDTPADVSFAGSYDNGRTVFLSTSEQLTPDPKDPGNAIYRYDVAADQLELFASHADGVLFMGASADGSTVVYRTAGFIPEMHVVRGGDDRALGTFGFTDTLSLFDAAANERADKRALRISGDGRAIVFASTGTFDGPPNGVMQVFRWTPEDGVRLISADARGAPVASEATIGNYSTAFPDRPRQLVLNTMRGRPSLGRVMSDDGQRVFFETATALAPEDVNGVLDVYEWRDGAMRLVSPGTQAKHAFYHDSSADGSTVFFTTRARLIPELDRNRTFDLYAAREGGGFPLPATPPACSGDRCQGDLAGAPRLPSHGSEAFRGRGNQADEAPARARHRVRKLTRRQVRVLARRGRAVMRVRADERGVLVATGITRLKKRRVRVARTVRAAKPGQTVRVPLKLSRRARRVLKRGRRLRLVVKVAYSESNSTARQVVVLRG